HRANHSQAHGIGGTASPTDLRCGDLRSFLSESLYSGTRAAAAKLNSNFAVEPECPCFLAACSRSISLWGSRVPLLLSSFCIQASFSMKLHCIFLFLLFALPSHFALAQTDQTAPTTSSTGDTAPANQSQA